VVGGGGGGGGGGNGPLPYDNFATVNKGLLYRFVIGLQNLWTGSACTSNIAGPEVAAPSRRLPPSQDRRATHKENLHRRAPSVPLVPRPATTLSESVTVLTMTTSGSAPSYCGPQVAPNYASVLVQT
jgi:hypothetical protein